MMRALYILAWTILITFILGIIALVLCFFGRGGNPVHKIASFWGRLILAANRTRVAVSGVSKIELDRPYIYMANHQSNFDIPVLLAHLPVQFRWLAKAELFKIPIFGRSMRGAGYISIDRFHKTAAYRSIEQAAEKVKAGVSVMIFPEGTRSADGNIQPFKKGGFLLALKAGVPIVPLIIRGTRQINPKGSFRVNAGTVDLEIQDPVDVTRYTVASKEALINHVHRIIRDAFAPGREIQTDA